MEYSLCWPEDFDPYGSGFIEVFNTPGGGDRYILTFKGHVAFAEYEHKKGLLNECTEL